MLVTVDSLVLGPTVNDDWKYHIVPGAQTIVDLLPRNTPRAHMSNCTEAVFKWHGGRRYALHLYGRWHKTPADQMS